MLSFARWDDDGDRQTLTFFDPGEPDVLEAKYTPIGSYSLKTQTWLWAWANDSLSEAARNDASKLKKLFERTGMRIFKDPHIGCDEFLAWELASAAVDELGSIGCYREPVDHLWIFVSIEAVAAVQRATVECQRHGVGFQTFVCKHLVNGSGQGFVCSANPSDLYPNAWCDACEAVRVNAGGWHQESEKVAEITLVCHRCYREMSERQAPPATD